MSNELDMFLNGTDGKPKKSEKIDGGARIGLRFENEIEATCLAYQTLKLAYIQKFEVPTRFIPKDPKTGKGGFSVKTKKTGFDFIGGVLEPEKNTIFIECKSTEKGGIQLWQEDSGIKRHQIEILKWLEECGFKTMILWQIRNAKTVFKFSAKELVEQVGGAKQLLMTHCEELRFTRVLKVKHGINEYWDFLSLL